MNPPLLVRVILSALPLGALLASAPARAGGNERAAQQAAAAKPAEFVCPPCGAGCHFTTYPKEGSCGGCGMKLVPLASVPQVGVMLHGDADLTSSALSLAVFAKSNAVRAFAVADTTEPLRLGDTLELRAQFAFADAPALDVLVLPDGFGAWEDELVVEWVKAAAAKARFVLATGGGAVLLAKAGVLPAGEHVPARDFLVKNGKRFATEVVFEAEPRWRRSGKLFLARDAFAALDASLAIVAELAGPEQAKRTAQELGHDWKPEAQ